MSGPDVRWQARLDELRAYRKEHGHCYIPARTARHRRLREWVMSQRAQYRRGHLGADQIKALEAIGIDWDAIGPHWDKWEDKYFALCRYKDENGDANPSQFERVIGPWLNTQRSRRRQGLLCEKREALLDKLGVDWDPAKSLDERWDEQFEKVKQFKKEHGHCMVPRRTMPDPGIWVSAQRTAYRNGTLSEERIKKLESIGFEWDASARKRTRDRRAIA